MVDFNKFESVNRSLLYASLFMALYFYKYLHVMHNVLCFKREVTIKVVNFVTGEEKTKDNN